MNFGLVETLLGTHGHNSVQKYIERTGKHLALISAALYAICFCSVAMNAQLTTADIIGTVSEPNYFVGNNQNDAATTTQSKAIRQDRYYKPELHAARAATRAQIIVLVTTDRSSRNLIRLRSGARGNRRWRISD